jgi:hypothetical protein
MIRILLVAALIAGALALAKQERVFARSGVVHDCYAIATPAGEDGFWVACQEGWLDGYPNLAIDSCDREGRSEEQEFWRCPVSLSGSYKP